MKLPRLVIVYLGARVPKYLIKNMEHLQKVFPFLGKSLVVDASSVKGLSAPQGWEVHTYVRTPETQFLLSAISLDHRFRDGFWLYTLERLFAFLELHQLRPDEPLLHIEGDVVLMPQFPFEMLAQLKTLAWLKRDSQEDVAAIVYSPSLTTSDFLASKIREEVLQDSSTSDMRALRSIATQFPEQVCYLPVSPDETNDWGGIFDPAAIGIWLLGVDPRNEAGRSIRRRLPYENPSLDVENVEFRIVRDQLEVRFPNKNWFPVWCLHLHSKFPEYFEHDFLLSALSRSIDNADHDRTSFGGRLAWLREVFRDLVSIRAVRRAFSRFSK